MLNSKRALTSPQIDTILKILGIPWLETAVILWQGIRKLWRGLASEGLYEVLEHASRLEICDAKGKQAVFHKQEKVRYLQDNILAYQDHAWGDGTILQNYHCTPGRVVDRYRPGHHTYLLISLREIKQKGDVDDFHIDWEMTDCFSRDMEAWQTEIRHRTKRVKVEIIFPADRPPRRVWLLEDLRRREKLLTADALRKLPDGRYALIWQTNKPRLHERYLLKWEW